MPENDVSVIPANEATWEDLQTVFGRGSAARPLTAAAVEYARSRGATAIEGYPMVPKPGQNVSWGEMNVGSRNTFVAAGFREVSHPTTRRVVMRLDLD
jgi:hypothetical protein